MNEPCSPDNFTVGWICALRHELTASQAVLDEIFHGLHLQHTSDDNVYTYGRIGNHMIVMVGLAGQYGLVAASTVANNLKRSFPSVRYGLMVGIGGGVWSRHNDVRLGDVCVSFPGPAHSGVVQYDLGKALPGGDFLRRGTLNKPPAKLLSAVENLRAVHARLPSALPSHLATLYQDNPAMRTTFSRPTLPDNLFSAGELVPRDPRPSDAPSIHYGLIASGNRVISSEQERDRLCAHDDIICFEMEAAGLMDTFPSLIIRGVCDYCDSRKNDYWQNYAAATAAAYAKELLSLMSAPEPSFASVKPSRASTLVVAAADDSPPVLNFDLPFSLKGLRPVVDFVGRDADMAAMERFLLDHPASANKAQRRKIFVLYGVGGIGKTSLSLHFAQKHQSSFDAILWINASSEDSVKQSFHDLAHRLLSANASSFRPSQIPDYPRAVLTWLALKGNQRWLLVFDNVDRVFDAAQPDPQAFDIEAYLPEADHGSILITSRLQTLRVLGESVELNGLDQQDSKKLLESQVHRSLKDDTDATTTVENLGGLPLALTLAGSLVQERRGTFKSYNEQYQSQWQRLISSQDVHARLHGHRHAVMTTWTVSYEQAKSQSPRATNLLELWSLLNHSRLQYSLFYPIARTMKRSHDWPTWLLELSTNDIDFFDEISRLIRYSLVSRVEDNECETYYVHPVIHEWCFQMLRSRDRASCRLLCETAAAIVAYQVPLDEEMSGFWKIMRDLLPHGHRAFLRVQECFEKSSSISATDDLPPDISSRLGRLIYRVGDVRDAESLLLRATRGFEESHRLRDENMLDALNLLGRIFARQKKFDKAHRVFLETLQRVEDAYGRDHVETLHLVNNLGNVYQEEGRNDEAIDLYQRVLEASDDDPLRLNTLSNMGRLWARRNNPALAIRFYKRALDCKKPGQDSLAAVQTTRNLGSTYYKLGRFKAACNTLETALEGYEKLLGKDDKSTLDAAKDLGSAYNRLGRTPKADECFSRVLAGYEKLSNKPMLLQLVRSVGRTREALGKFDDAMIMYRRLVDENEAALGAYDVSTLDASRYLGRVLRKKNMLRTRLTAHDLETKDLLERACEGYKETLGLYHRKTRQMVEIMRNLYGYTGENDERYDWYRTVQTWATRKRAHLSPRTSNNSSSIASQMMDQENASPTRPLSRDGSSGRSSGRSSSPVSARSRSRSVSPQLKPPPLHLQTSAGASDWRASIDANETFPMDYDEHANPRSVLDYEHTNLRSVLDYDEHANPRSVLDYEEPANPWSVVERDALQESAHPAPPSGWETLEDALQNSRVYRASSHGSCSDCLLEALPAKPSPDDSRPAYLRPKTTVMESSASAAAHRPNASPGSRARAPAESQLREFIHPTREPTPTLGSRIRRLFHLNEEPVVPERELRFGAAGSRAMQ